MYCQTLSLLYSLPISRISGRFCDHVLLRRSLPQQFHVDPRLVLCDAEPLQILEQVTRKSMRDGQLPGQCIAFHHRPSPIVVSHACRHRNQNLTGRRHATGKTAAARTALSTSPSTKGTAPSANAFSIPTNAVSQPTPNR